MFAGVIFSVFSLTLLGVSGQAINSSCTDCDCCIDGLCNRKGDHETCDYGCADGHWGTHCMYDCPQNCNPCYTNNGHCKTCMDGLYGQYCNYTCLPNCASCYGSTSCKKCKDGFYIGQYHDLLGSLYSHDCHLECQVNCKRCTSYGRCQERKPDENRNISCVNCSCCVAGSCILGDDDQTCDYGCTDGHWGTHCMYDCGKNCARCSQTSGESRISGCVSNACSRDTLLQTTGVCTECIGGLYGPYCNNTCLARCATCSSSATCTSCKDVFYIGRYKDQPGSQYLNDCQLACPVNCTKCSSFGSCTKCQTGKFGTTCSSLCSQGCANNVCSQSNGHCECSEGFKGFSCDNCMSGTEGDKCALSQTAAKGDNNIAMYVLVGVTCLVTGLLIAIGVVMCIRYQRKRYGIERSGTGVDNQEIQDGETNDQPESNTNLSLATFVNEGAEEEHYYTSLHSRNTENPKTGSVDKNIEPDYETPRNYK